MLVLLTPIPGHKPDHNENIPGAAVGVPVPCRGAAAAAAGGAGVNLMQEAPELPVQLLLFAFMGS